MVKERSKSWSYDHEYDSGPVGYDLMKSINMDSDWWCSRFRSSRCDSTYNYELLMELINQQTNVKGKFIKSPSSAAIMKNDARFASESEHMVMGYAKESAIKTAETVTLDKLYKGGGEENKDNIAKKDNINDKVNKNVNNNRDDNAKNNCDKEKEEVKIKKNKRPKKAFNHGDKIKRQKQKKDENVETKSLSPSVNDKTKLIDDPIIDESYWKRQTKNKARKSWIAKSLRTISCFGGRVVN